MVTYLYPCVLTGRPSPVPFSQHHRPLEGPSPLNSPLPSAVFQTDALHYTGVKVPMKWSPSTHMTEHTGKQWGQLCRGSGRCCRHSWSSQDILHLLGPGGTTTSNQQAWSETPRDITEQQVKRSTSVSAVFQVWVALLSHSLDGVRITHRLSEK